MKCLFIFNPKSGKGKIVKKADKIAEKLGQSFDSVTLHPSTSSQDVFDQIVLRQNEIDCVVVAGGDGTISQAVNAIMHTGKKIKLGILPFGTVNDVAHSLKIPRNTNKALGIILKGQTFLHDVIKINDRYGIYVFGCGVFTETSYNTSQKAKKSFGRVAYGLHALKKLKETKNNHLSCVFDGEKFCQLSCFLLLSNSRYVAGQKIERKAQLNDGKARVVLIKSKRQKPSLKDLARIVKLFLFGQKNSKNVVVRNIQKAQISCQEKINFNLDGEQLAADKINLCIVKQGLEIFAAKK